VSLIERLRRRADFQRVYREGRKAVGRFVVVFAQTGEIGVRIGITASRRIGGAVVRNRARRRIRALVRQMEGTLANLHGEVVVNVRRGCAEAPWDLLVRDFAECLAKAVGRRGSPGG